MQTRSPISFTKLSSKPKQADRGQFWPTLKSGCICTNVHMTITHFVILVSLVKPLDSERDRIAKSESVNSIDRTTDSEIVSETVGETVSETVNDAVSETVSDTFSETVNGTPSASASESVSETPCKTIIGTVISLGSVVKSCMLQFRPVMKKSFEKSLSLTT